MTETVVDANEKILLEMLATYRKDENVKFVIVGKMPRPDGNSDFLYQGSTSNNLDDVLSMAGFLQGMASFNVIQALQPMKKPEQIHSPPPGLMLRPPFRGPPRK